MGFYLECQKTEMQCILLAKNMVNLHYTSIYIKFSKFFLVYPKVRPKLFGGQFYKP